MNVSRSGIWLTISPSTDCPNDLPFLEEIGAIYVEKARIYRIRYSEPIFHKLTEYLSANNGTMDSTCIALAMFKATWADSLSETEVTSKRLPMRHQKQGVTFLLDLKRAMLGFDMGTGKTKTAVDTATKLFDEHRASFALVVTDASVVSTWVDTLIPEDSDYPAIALIGSRTDRISRLRWGLANGYRFFVINYDGVPVIEDELLHILDERCILILDESQRVKNHTTKRFKSLWKLYSKHEFEYVFLLSGTPITQSPEDAFGQYAFVDTRIFGHPKSDWYRFRATYVQTSPHDQHVVVGYRNMKRFLEKFHSRCFRIQTSDVLDLPPKRFIPIKLPLPAQLDKVYKDFVRSRGFIRVPGHPRQGDRDELFVTMHPMTMLQKGLQLINNFIYLTTDDDDSGCSYTEAVTLFEDCVSPKLDFLMQLLEDTDQPIVVWFWHRAMRYFLERRLMEARIPYVVVDGSIAPEKRAEPMRLFTTGKVRVLAAQENTLRTGVNLTHSRISVYLERWFSCETRQQSEKRIHRLGMDESVENVLYYDLLYDKTVDMTVYDKQQKGIELSSAIVNLDNVQLMLTGAWDTQ